MSRSVDLGPGEILHFNGQGLVVGPGKYRVGFYLRNLGPAVIDNLVMDMQLARVPEPASWAMMILGGAVAGAATRRRRRPACA